MKKFLLLYVTAAVCLLGMPAFSQDKTDSTSKLDLAGDNLDLYAVMDLFQQSKTIEGFEKSLNEESKERINNLDLNMDKKVDFIKVVTKKNGDAYQFILQVDVTKTETQDVAVILLNKDKDGKVSLQIVGDEELYGKDYVIEPKGNSSVTANPAYKGADPVTQNVEAKTTVVVQSAPVVQYVYSPAYVPYYPPYYYGYYPPWFGFMTVMAVGIYRSNHYYHCGGYYGGHYHGGGNNVFINTGNRNNFNNYNNNKMRSNTVSNNRANGNYGSGAGANRRGGGTSASTRPSTMQSDRGGNRPTTSNRQSPSTSNRQSPSTSNRSSYSPSSSSRSGSMGGGSRSMGGGFGGGARGGGGGGRRR